MSHQTANLRDEGGWSANLWKGLKVESTIKIWMIFLPPMEVVTIKL